MLIKHFVLALAIVVLSSAEAARAAYDFLTVAATGTNTSTFTSLHGNGTITVTDTWTTGSPAALENVNTAIFPSQFQTLFPGTGQVQGHLFQSNINSTSTAVFDLTNYNLSSTTAFGIWNIIDEASNVYNIQLLDASNNIVSPTTFSKIGNQENEPPQVAGRHHFDLNTTTGNLELGALYNPLGTHTDAVFFDNIPVGTKQIIITGRLGNFTTGDGVGYYFAEVVPSATGVPEPAGIAVWCVGGLISLGYLRIRQNAVTKTRMG